MRQLTIQFSMISKDKSDEAAISSSLEFPRVPEHEVEVGVLVDGGGDAAVVIQELVRGDLAIAHCVRSLDLEVFFCGVRHTGCFFFTVTPLKLVSMENLQAS